MYIRDGRDAAGRLRRGELRGGEWVLWRRLNDALGHARSSQHPCERRASKQASDEKKGQTVSWRAPVSRSGAVGKGMKQTTMGGLTGGTGQTNDGRPGGRDGVTRVRRGCVNRRTSGSILLASEKIREERVSLVSWEGRGDDG